MPQGLSGWDLYRRIPRDLTHATGQGGLFSVTCCTVMVVLFSMELWDYLRPPVVARLHIDRNTEPTIRVNFNITALDLPCQWLRLEVRDALGARKYDVVENVRKWTLSSKESRLHVESERELDHAAHHTKEEMDEAVRLADGDSPKVDGNALSGVLSEKKYVFVDFYAPWCIWCRRLGPIWEAFAKKVHDEHYHIAVRKVDCTEQPGVCAQYRVRAFPTLRLFKRGHAIADFDGERSSDGIMEWAAAITGEDEQEHRVDQPTVVGQNEEHLGCMVSGHLMLNRVPGNFHIVAKSKEHSFNAKETNLSHVVHHLSFGNPDDLPPEVEKAIPWDQRERMAPLDHRMFISESRHMTHEHHMQIVTTWFDLRLLSAAKLGYQIQHTNYQYNIDDQRADDDDGADTLPEARFAYDLSPAAVTIAFGGRRWYEFLTHCFAIIGGVFTVMGLVNRSVHGIRRKVWKGE